MLYGEEMILYKSATAWETSIGKIRVWVPKPQKRGFCLVRIHPKTSPNKAMDLLLYLGCRYARFFLKKLLFIVSKIQERHERPLIKKIMRKRKFTARTIVILPIKS